MRNIINICQPGCGASCSYCCGSHNFAMPPERIDDLLMERGRAAVTRPMRLQEDSHYEKPYPEEMQCPHMGIQPSDPGIVRCLVYDEQGRGREFESFFNGTCKGFRCQAWSDLTDEQVIFAARLMRDWYYYGLFINDIEEVQEMHAAWGNPENVPSDELESLKERLIQRRIDEDGR
jgi:hypothetical protein